MADGGPTIGCPGCGTTVSLGALTHEAVRETCPSCAGRFDVVRRAFVGDGPLRSHEQIRVANFIRETPNGIEDLSQGLRLRHVRITKRVVGIPAGVEEVWLDGHELVRRERAALPPWHTDRVPVADVLELTHDDGRVRVRVARRADLLIGEGMAFEKQTLRWICKYLERGIALLRSSTG